MPDRIVRAPLGLRVIAVLICCFAAALLYPVLLISFATSLSNLPTSFFFLFSFLVFPTFFFFLGCSLWSGSRMGRRITLTLLWVTCVISASDVETSGAAFWILVLCSGPLIYLCMPSVHEYVEFSERSVRIFDQEIPGALIEQPPHDDETSALSCVRIGQSWLPLVLSTVIGVCMTAATALTVVESYMTEGRIVRGYAHVQYGDSQAKVKSLLGEPTDTFETSYTPQFGWERCDRWNSDGPHVQCVFRYEQISSREWMVGFDRHGRAVAKSELFCSW